MFPGETLASSLFCCLLSPCLAACSDHGTARWPRSQSLHIHLVEVLICVFHACTHKLVCTLRSTWACFGVLSKPRPAEQTASLCKRRGGGGGKKKENTAHACLIMTGHSPSHRLLFSPPSSPQRGGASLHPCVIVAFLKYDKKKRY